MTLDLPDEAYAAALAMRPNVGPATLRSLFGDHPPKEAWERTASGSGDAQVRVRQAWQLHREHGITVLLPDHPSYPGRCREDTSGFPLLFCKGDPGVLHRTPTVALVGTRAPTRYGIGIAAQLGADLSAAGVSIVSGLALGIDAAAHEGACGSGAPPIGVVAGGLDDPYPRRNARLWQRVTEHGAIISESPAGTATEKWRFPVRNRLLAAMSDVVVVVESRHHGGSYHTVEAAIGLNKPVGAVPGSIRSATSEGTNALLADGAFLVSSAGDILIRLALEGFTVPASPPRSGSTPGPARPRPTPEAGDEKVVYDVLTTDPVSLDQLVRVTGLGLPALCGALERLARAGLARDAGGWWQRV
jgi:DNA processing protein